MISMLALAIVAIAFVVAIVSVWLSKPINKGLFFHDTGYDEKHPPTPEEWRKTQVRYTLLLVFLGIFFTIVTGISTNGLRAVHPKESASKRIPSDLNICTLGQLEHIDQGTRRLEG